MKAYAFPLKPLNLLALLLALSQFVWAESAITLADFKVTDLSAQGSQITIKRHGSIGKLRLHQLYRERGVGLTLTHQETEKLIAALQDLRHQEVNQTVSIYERNGQALKVGRSESESEGPIIFISAFSKDLEVRLPLTYEEADWTHLMAGLQKLEMALRSKE